MGFWDTITDLVEAATPWSTAEAEAPPEDKVREFILIAHLLSPPGSFSHNHHCCLRPSTAQFSTDSADVVVWAGGFRGQCNPTAKSTSLTAHRT